MNLILASTSPRRQGLLRRAGYHFIVRPSNVDESVYPANILPADLALHLARIKAQAVAPHFPQDCTLAADTVVALGDMALGQPADEHQAREMLCLLSGTTQVVITAVVVQAPNSVAEVQVSMSAVRMTVLTTGEIEEHVRSGLWRGKAGGYGLQDPHPLVRCTAGSQSNVVGLPMELVVPMLDRAGIAPHPADA